MKRRMKIGTLQLVLVACVDIYAAAATAAGPLSLQECITQAIHDSPALSAARHDVQAAREGVTETKGSLLPALAAGTSAYEVNGKPTTPFSALRIFQPGENPRENAHWGPVGIETIGVTYPLIQGGGILGLFNDPPQIAAARAMVDERLAGILLVEQKVVFDTATDYIYAASYHSEMRLVSRILDLSDQRLEIIKYQAELGLRLPQDVELASAQVSAAQQAALSAKLNADDSVTALAAEMGRQNADITVDTAGPMLPSLPPLREFLAHVMPSHPALRVQQGEVEVAQQQVRVDKAALFPSVKLNLNLAGAQDLEHFGGGTLSNFLSFIQVDIPIFDFGRRRAAIRASKEKAASAVDSLNAMALQIRNSISEAYHEINDFDQQVAALQTYLLQAENDAALADAQYSQGLIDKLAWVDAQIKVSVAQVALCRQELLLQLRYAELGNLSGGIWHWLDSPEPTTSLAATPPRSSDANKHVENVVPMPLVPVAAPLRNKTESHVASAVSGTPAHAVTPQHSNSNSHVESVVPIPLLPVVAPQRNEPGSHVASAVSGTPAPAVTPQRNNSNSHVAGAVPVTFVPAATSQNNDSSKQPIENLVPMTLVPAEDPQRKESDSHVASVMPMTLVPAEAFVK